MAAELDQMPAEAGASDGWWSSSLELLSEALEKYQNMVVRDPDLTSKLECAFRFASYIIPGG